MAGITKEEILNDLQRAIEAHPYDVKRTKFQTDLLEYLKVARENDLNLLTTKQIAAALDMDRGWTGKVLSDLETDGLVVHEAGRNNVYLWRYNSCEENTAQG